MIEKIGVIKHSAKYFILILFLSIYASGLNGGFVLDDFGNISKLGDYNGVRNFDTFLQFITSGIAGPTGRPISLLSFLLNSNTWPADPYPFKLTNVIIHGINGLLLFAIVQQILTALKFDDKLIQSVALFSSLLWLAHPFHVSTVLYVVQRMAMLVTLFSLIGIWLYCKGRLRLQTDRLAGYRLMTAGVVAGTLLATFSKENGALLPLLILCLELTLFTSSLSTLPKLTLRWKVTFLFIPALLIILYLLSRVHLDRFDIPLAHRGFSLKQRLLTESRIVVGYLYNLLIPQMYYSGVFNESIRLSNSLLDPITTLPSVIAVIFLPLSAFLLRHKYPFWAFAVLFFFAGHLVESTTITLELYFEHRNYLPSLFLFLPFVNLVYASRNKIGQIGLTLYLVICCFFTYQRSSLWGKPIELSLFWANQNQQSARAQRTAALILEDQGHINAAFNILDQAKDRLTDSLDVKMHWALLKCRLHDVNLEDHHYLLQAAATQFYTSKQYNLLEAFINHSLSQQCSGLNPDFALQILKQLEKNPSVQKNKRVIFQFNHLRGIVYLSTQKPDLAYHAFHKALGATHRIEHGLLQSALLASNHHYNLALKHLDYTETFLPEHKPIDYFSSKHDEELIRLKKQIEADAKTDQRDDLPE